MLVRELLFELGFDDAAATRNAKRFDKVIAGVKRNVLRLGAAAGAAAITLGAKALQAGNDYQEMSNKIKLVTKDVHELKRAQEGVFGLSQRARTSLEASTDLYFGFSKAAEKYGYSQERILRITETTAKLATLASNKDPAGTNAALFQLRQGIMSGQLRGQELNSVLEQATPVADAIAAGMGIPFDEIRKKAEKGLITGEAVLAALESQAAKTDAEFAKMDRTARQARTQFRNAFGFYAGRLAEDGDAIKAQIEFWDSLRDIVSSEAFRGSLVFGLQSITAIIKAANRMITIINDAIAKVGGLTEAFRLLASAILAVVLVSTVRALPTIALWSWYLIGLTANAIAAAGGFWAMAAGVLAATWPILAIIAAVVALTLVIDDLWAYFTGGESVIIPNLIKAWGWLQSVIGTFFETVRGWAASFKDWFMDMIAPVLNAIERVKNGFNSIKNSNWNPGNWFDGNDGGGGTAQSAAALLGSQTYSQSSVFKPQVNINVPPGTMREQVDYMDNRFRGLMDEYNAEQLRAARNNFPEVE